MTTQKSAPAVLALSVKDLLKHASEALVLEKFVLTGQDYFKRSRSKYVLKEGSKYSKYHEEVYRGPTTIDGTRQWLDMMEAISKSFEPPIMPVIEADYDGKLCAYFEVSRPFTEEEKAEARAWLEAHPEPPEGEKIQWRRPMGFGDAV